MGYSNWNGFVKYDLWQNFYIEKKLTNDKSEDSSYKMHSVSKQNKSAKKYLTASTNDYITLVSSLLLSKRNRLHRRIKKL